MIAGKFEQCVHRFFRAQAHNFSTQIPGALLVVEKMPLRGCVDAVTRFALGFDVNDKPVGVETSRQARTLPEQQNTVGRRSRGQTYHHAFARGGSARRVIVVGFGGDGAIDAFGDFTQRDLAQHGQFLGRKKFSSAQPTLSGA